MTGVLRPAVGTVFNVSASCYNPDCCQSDLYSGPAGTASHRFAESHWDDILADIEDPFVEELPFGSCGK